MSNPEGKIPANAKDFKFPEEAGLADVVETNEAPKQKYVVGQVVKNWGSPDEYNEPYQDAVRAGFITEKCELTEEGVEHLLNGGKKSLGKIDETVIGEVVGGMEETKQSQPKITIPVSSGYRRNKVETAMGDFEKKKLLDAIHDVLEKRGYNILGVSAELSEERVNGEKIYTLRIEFGKNGGGDKKQKKTLRLVGSEESLVDTLESDNFNFPTSKNPKKLRRAFK